MPYARKGRYVFYWYSSFEVACAHFVSWCRMRNGSGGKDTNKIGTGAVLFSTWRYDRVLRKRIPKGLTRGYDRLHPYHPIFDSYNSAWARDPKHLIIRPSPDKVKNKKKYKLVIRKKKTVNKPKKNIR